jgi:hypothetical protein
MHIKIFLNSANSDEERTLLLQFGEGVQNWINRTQVEIDQTYQSNIGKWKPESGHCLQYTSADEYEDCDVAVIFGSAKPREKGHHLVRSSVFSRSECFVVLETPLLARRTNEANQYWRVGINGYLNDNTFWPEVDPGVTRRSLFVDPWAGWKNSLDGHILLALQLPGDASMRGRDVSTWAYDTIQKIRSYSNRPLRIRSHPLTSDRAWTVYHSLLAKLMVNDLHHNITLSDGALVPWSKDFQDAYCTVSFTSGVSVDSVLQGIPVLPTDPGNFTWGFSSHLFTELDKLQMASAGIIEQWLENLAWAQWSGNEMQQGLTWARLLPKILQIINQ